MGVEIQLFEVGPYRSDFCLWGWMKSEVLQRKSKQKRRIGRWHYEQCCHHKARTPKTTSGELHVLLPRELKSALKSMMGIF
jgi:hypothetical protein